MPTPENFHQSSIDLIRRKSYEAKTESESVKPITNGSIMVDPCSTIAERTNGADRACPRMAVRLMNRPLYKADKFVEQPQSQLVLDAIRAVQRKNNADALVFRGARGAGKTWFALDLHCNLIRDVFPDGVESFYITMEAPSATEDIQCQNRYYLEDMDSSTVPEELRKLYEKLSVPTAVTASYREQDEWAARTFSKTSQEANLPTWVFFIDGAFEADSESLHLLEEHLLAHLVTRNRTLIVILGRGKSYQWRRGIFRQDGKSYELRYWGERGQEVIDSDLAVDVPLEQTKANREEKKRWMSEQADKLGLALSDEQLLEIADITYGYPWGNYVLMTKGVSPDAAEELVDALIGTENLGVKDEDGHTLRDYFTQLAPLNGFREEDIELLLLAGDTNKRRKSREIRQRLVDTQLVQWGRGSAWRIDEALRRPLDWWLQKTDLERWTAIHRTVRDEWMKWADEEEPGSADKAYFLERAQYHINKLNEFGIDCDPEQEEDSYK